MLIKTANGTEELCQGEALIVNFDSANAGGVYGHANGCKVIPSPGVRQIHTGERWVCWEITRWRGGTDKPDSQLHKNYQAWGGVIYVWPVRKLA